MTVIEVTDKPLLRRRLSRAAAAKRKGADFLLRIATDEIVERLEAVERVFEDAVVLGGQIVGLADRVAAAGKAERVYRIEPAAEMLPGEVGAVADEEKLPLRAGSVNLVISPLLLQWTNDLPGALLQIRNALKPDGLFLGVIAGGETLRELREALVIAETEISGGASPRVLPFADIRDLGALLQRAGFALPVVDRDILTVRYDSAFDLFADLRGMGAANALVERSRRPTPRNVFLRAAEVYAERFADIDGRIRATFELISLSGWAPHESQQQPAPRGSGQIGLGKVLKHRAG
jgi:SAM-dependent methyltransferase